MIGQWGFEWDWRLESGAGRGRRVGEGKERGRRRGGGGSQDEIRGQEKRHTSSKRSLAGEQINTVLDLPNLDL